MSTQGWECPKCHRVYGPAVRECLECQPGRVDLAKGPIAAPFCIQCGALGHDKAACPQKPSLTS